MADHAMVSLQGERDKDSTLATSGDDDGPFFPVSLWLNEPEITKLGLVDAKVGEEHNLEAVVRVTSVSIDESVGRPKSTSMTLTFLKGAVHSDHGEDEEARASKVFDK